MFTSGDREETKLEPARLDSRNVNISPAPRGPELKETSFQREVNGRIAEIEKVIVEQSKSVINIT